ncbi:type II secretion system protein GspM [uncultured Methylobacterium sp.]|uniref:type II secretion system protein GspM n=1 Tax=uncultured Methylobacterium sp. TaxID=157278 RepID=UPI0035CC0E7E
MTLSQAREARWFGPLAVALFVGAPLLLVALTLSNLVRWSEAGAAAAETRGHLAQLEDRIRAEAGRAAPVRGDMSTLYLTAGTGSLAHAELQQRLVGLVERAGGRLIEVRGDEAPEAAAQRSILLRVSLDIGNDGLFDLLSGIEAGLPILTVEALNVRAASGRGAGDEADPTLRVALAVRGYRREEAP